MACQNGRPNWLELHSDLLELILKKLVLPDIVRFKSVCSLWKTAAESYMASPIYAPLLRPLLLHHNSQQQQQQEFEADNSSSLFYSHEEKKVYKLNNLFGVFGKNAWCVGSTRGWMVILDARLNLHLLNPISRARIQLSMTPQYRNNHLYINQHTNPKFPRFYIVKAVLLSDPSHGKNFILVVMFTMAKNLAFYNYRDNKWKHFGDKENYYDICGHSSGQLYALCKSQALEIWDFQGGSNIPRIVQRVKYSTPLRTLYKTHPKYVSPRTDRTRLLRYYLVEYSSSGEVLVVSRIVEYSMPLFVTKYYSSVQFIVFRMDFNAEKWVNVKILLDRAIFLDANESISVSTRDFPECQENSIYFTDNYIDWSNGRHLGAYNGRDIGVYNFKRDKFTSREELYGMKITDLQPNNSRCFWFVPT